MMKAVKYTLSILTLLAVLAITDLNPLLLWEPYRVGINNFFHAMTPLIGNLFFFSVFTAIAVLGALAESKDKPRVSSS
jgi:hypothetical protein